MKSFDTARRCVQSWKECHASRGKAEAHLNNLREEKGYEGHTYHCVFCGGWHVGREKNNAHRSKYK